MQKQWLVNWTGSQRKWQWTARSDPTIFLDNVKNHTSIHCHNVAVNNNDTVRTIHCQERYVNYFDVCTVHLVQFIVQTNKCTTYIRRVQPTRRNVSQFIYFCKTLCIALHVSDGFSVHHHIPDAVCAVLS